MISLFKRDPQAEYKRELSNEARRYASIISKRLERMNICYRYAKNAREFGTPNVDRVNFSHAYPQNEAIYLRIDDKLPRGVLLSDINKPEVLGDLSVSCRRPVKYRRVVQTGAWLIVEREAGVSGILNMLPFNDMVDNWPETYKPLIVPMGVGENRKLVYKSLASFPHALVAGATDAGKSTLLHAWICGLIMNNTPEALKIGLIDLKRGVSFSRYQELPHVIENGFIKAPEDVTQFLDELLGLMDDRYKQLESDGIQDIGEWNRRRPTKAMYRVVVFIDEIAALMRSPDMPKLRKAATPRIGKLLEQARGVGIHLVIATQRPTVDVVPGSWKGNMEARCAMRMTDDTSSRVILDDSSAARFPRDTPRGRYIYKRGLVRELLQGPWISSDDIDKIIKNAMHQQQEHERENLELEHEILRIAINKNSGSLSRRTLKGFLGDRVTMQYLKELGQNYEGKTVVIDGVSYEVLPSSGQKPRCIAPVSSDIQPITHNPQN